MQYSEIVKNIFANMIKYAKENKHEYITPEHLLYIITKEEVFNKSFIECGGNIEKLKDDLQECIRNNVDIVENVEPELSYSLKEVLAYSEVKARSSEREKIELTHIIDGILNLKDSYATYYILYQGIELVDLLYAICDYDEKNNEDIENNLEVAEEGWKEFVTCLNNVIYNYPPLIGREEELERTMQILSRKYKNNPIHVGEAGVGKTSIAYGLVRLINEDMVPDNLKGAKVYLLDLGTLIAGTQFRGDFEKRFKMIMEGVKSVEKSIIYIDEIHNIVGAGQVSGGSLDVSNMLKPYLTSGQVRVIGATTYEEYNKYFAKSKSLLRRFQKIDISEPSIDETVRILDGIKEHYENYHNVKYSKGTIEHAVVLSNKYINERYLPDKAIDLIDEAGAYRVLHPINKRVQTVDKKLIEEVLAKTCNIPKESVENNEIKKLSILEKRLKAEVFGQDEAINELVKSIKLARAGLNEENKPIAKLLFVGPTGVGKTEIARTLAKTLDIKLIRFDMSEYMEKHSIAKLIGSPAGYVGYEEGGLLTDAVKQTPHCVLLLDEIEKAHRDVFNILLQVMDYATLTDNKGRKTDFRNAIIIMTSNAGARNVNKSLIGFGERIISNEGIKEEVKKIFTPEFRNRLSKIIIFNNLNSEMAERIVEKNINSLKKLLKEKNIQLIVTKSAGKYIINKGITKEYGAREIARVIDNEIKPKLVEEMLFGRLSKKGGRCKIDLVDNEIKLIIKE